MAKEIDGGNNQVLVDRSSLLSFSLPAATPINEVFPDSNLAEAVRAELEKPTITALVTQGELDTIINIYANYDDIQNIEGMEYINNLKELILSYNQITYISPLENLSYLDELYLDNNPIGDHSPLANLSSLTWLSIYGTNILSNLTNLKYLDISPLANLTQLTWFSAFSNQITNMDVVGNFPELINLNLYNNKIENISSVSDFI